MLNHYLSIAIRNLLKQKLYSSINILGLAIGLASCVLIILYVMEHLSFDRFHERADRIYRVIYSGNLGGENYKIGGTPPPLAHVLQTEFPEVELTTRIYPYGEVLTRHKDKLFTEKYMLEVDTNFFKIFSFNLVDGDITTVFKEPNTIVITQSAAAKYFGNEPAMGKILHLFYERTPYKVVGIVEDSPQNSHLTLNMLASIHFNETVKEFDWSWIWCGVMTYVQLKENTGVQSVESKFPAMIKQHAANTIETIFGTSIQKFEETGGKINMSLLPLTDIHLYGEGIKGLGVQSDIKYLYIFMLIASVILVLACINFMNLSTARSAGRSKEVGVRKVLGSVKSQLITQFLTESIVTSLIAMLLAFGICELFLLLFKDVLFDGLTTTLLQQNWLWLIVPVLIFLVGILAGSYPAFYLSAFKPVDVLKGKLRMGVKSSLIRSGLVVFQFSVSICLIICTLLFFQQLSYLSNKNLGFTKENVVVISHADRLENNAQAFKNALEALPQVQGSSYSSNLPAIYIDGELFKPEGENKKETLLSFISADYDYLKTLNIQIKEGRDFSRDFPSDADAKEGAVLINESAARVLGWENPIGKHLMSSRDENNRKIIGIFKDINFKSLHKPIEPLLIVLSTEGSFLSVRIKPGEIKQTLEAIENQWGEYAPNVPFEYSFLDENIEAQYKSEQQTGRIFGIFTGLAIFIACLGLFGLSAFTAEQRTKEIGIRKVLGASVISIVHLLSTNFFKLILIANLIAWPVAWYTMNAWLQNYEYQIKIEFWTFILAALLALTTALFTIIFQAIKAARCNPVHSLRSE